MSAVTEQAQTIRQHEADDNRRRATAARASRSVDKSTRANGRGAGGRGGGGMPTVRRGCGSRAPASSSQFHFNRKYSNRAGSNRAPSSALNKMLYDHGLDERGADRVDFTYVSALPGTPRDALDLRFLAIEAERTAGRQVNSRQMAHDTISLPSNLSKEGRKKLARSIAREVSVQMDGVPVFVAVHAPDGGNGNWHMHLSRPLRHIQPVGNDGAVDGVFKMGDRIMFEQRPATRKAAGLPPTNHADLRNLRATVAACIANALKHERADIHDVERWRNGHLKLGQQVEKAARRGDIQFVVDSASRSATRKEGLDSSAWRAVPMDGRREAAQAHNKAIKDAQADTLFVSPELMTTAAVQRVLTLAQKAGVTDPEQLRRLMHDHGIKMTWSPSKDGKVRGVSFALDGGPRVTGKTAGASLPMLKNRFSWTETPAYRRNVISSGRLFDDYKQTLGSSDIRPQDLTLGAFKSVMQRADHLVDQAQKVNAPKAAPAATLADIARQGDGNAIQAPERQRPKRASSTIKKVQTPTQATPVPASRVPTSKQATPVTPPIQEKDVIDAMTAKKWMVELSTLPPLDDDDTGTSTRGKGKSGGRGAAHAPAATIPIAIAIDPAGLTQTQRILLAEEWDRREAYRLGSFGGPLHDAQQQLQDIGTRLRLHQSNQPPLDQQQERQEKKRLFRKPQGRWVETPQMAKWRAFHDRLVTARKNAEAKINDLIDAACDDPKLLALLPQLQNQHDSKVAENAARTHQEARKNYTEAVQRLHNN